MIHESQMREEPPFCCWVSTVDRQIGNSALSYFSQAWYLMVFFDFEQTKQLFQWKNHLRYSRISQVTMALLARHSFSYSDYSSFYLFINHSWELHFHHLVRSEVSNTSCWKRSREICICSPIQSWNCFGPGATSHSPKALFADLNLLLMIQQCRSFRTALSSLWRRASSSLKALLCQHGLYPSDSPLHLLLDLNLCEECYHFLRHWKILTLHSRCLYEIYLFVSLQLLFYVPPNPCFNFLSSTRQTWTYSIS